MSIEIIHNNYTSWSKEVARKLKQYPLVKTKLKTSTFKKMFIDGYTTGEALRIAFLNSWTNHRV